MQNERTTLELLVSVGRPYQCCQRASRWTWGFSLIHLDVRIRFVTWAFDCDSTTKSRPRACHAQAAAALKLQQKLHFLDRERLSAKPQSEEALQ